MLYLSFVLKIELCILSVILFDPLLNKVQNQEIENITQQINVD